MSDGRKELTPERLLYWLSQAKWRCPNGDLANKESKQALQQIRQLIQRKPKIDEKYVEEKAKWLYEAIDSWGNMLLIQHCKGFITQIISDVKGK